MHATVLLGLLFALITALTAVIGFLMKHRGAVVAPAIDARHPVRTSIALFRHRWYTLGILVAMGSWGFHVAALALAPISLAPTVIAGGLVFVTVLADRLFGLRVTRREIVGVVLAAAGLAILAATLDGAADSAHDQYQTRTLLLYIAAIILVGLATAGWARKTANGGPLLGVAAGCLWGASDVCIKALVGGIVNETVATLTHPLVLVIVGASLVGMTVSARSLQIGPPIAVIAMTTAAANISTILAGPVVFDEPFPDDAGGVTLRVVAFALVIVAATMTPPPATSDLPATEVR